jgi:uncharacterized membrane protein
LASRFNDFFGRSGTRYIRPRTPDSIEKTCGWLSLILLVCVLAAVFRGRAQWHEIPWQIWVHLASLVLVLVITPVMMWRKRGDDLHRLLGWIWSAAMMVAALVSFNMRFSNQGGFSVIHILSVIVVIGVPVIVISARRRDIEKHRRRARGMVIGALLVAGFFTFPFHRLLGSWLFG